MRDSASDGVEELLANICREEAAWLLYSCRNGYEDMAKFGGAHETDWRWRKATAERFSDYGRATIIHKILIASP